MNEKFKSFPILDANSKIFENYYENIFEFYNDHALIIITHSIIWGSLRSRDVLQVSVLHLHPLPLRVVERNTYY